MSLIQPMMKTFFFIRRYTIFLPELEFSQPNQMKQRKWPDNCNDNSECLPFDLQSFDLKRAHWK